MEKIKTIDEFVANYWSDDENTNERVRKKFAKDMAIDFARYHVDLALKQVLEKVVIETDDCGLPYLDEGFVLLNAYPLSNIS